MGAGENHTENNKELKATEEEKLVPPVATQTNDAASRKKAEEGVRTPPDGGWGWVVVAASFMCNMTLDGIAYSYGILLSALMEHFGEGKGLMSLVGSILAGVIMLVGPIASGLTNKFGTRVVCIIGAVTSSFAIFISTYSPNVPFLMFSYGVVGGLGLGLMYVPAVVAVGYWFEKRRSLVTGISTCGSGAGTIVFAPLVTALEKSYGWQGCNQILAGLCLLCALFGLTMKPVPLKKPDEEDSLTEIKRENTSAGPYSDAEFDYMDGEKVNGREQLQLETQTEEKPVNGGICQTLRNPAFLLIMLANLPAVMGLYIPYMFLPAMSEERGLTKEQGAALISLIGLFNTAGRVISGAITDHPKVDALFVTCLALLSGALCPFFMDLCGSDFASYIVVSIMFGFSLSAWPAVTSSMLVDLLGLEQLTSGFGALTCIRGLAAFLGPPLGGFVIDNSGGNYSYAFYIAAALLGSSSIVHFLAFLVKRKLQANK